jgi:short-subunit dehydrogenase
LAEWRTLHAGPCARGTVAVRFKLHVRRPTVIEFSGNAAAVTGAASGIGRALALQFAQRGCDLALADVDDNALQSVAAEIRTRYQRKVLVHHVDVANRAQVEDFAREATATFTKLRILVNNAGVALQGQFEELDLSQIEWLMSINFWGVVYGTRAFLPHLCSQSAAHIVNMSSIFGLVAPPGQCAYAASKFAVRGFSESVRHELVANKRTVCLSVVHPGAVKTNIARNSRAGAHMLNQLDQAALAAGFEQLAGTTPLAAAQRIVRGIERNEPRILIGGDARFMDLIQRLKPAGYLELMSRLARIARARGRGAP